MGNTIPLFLYLNREHIKVDQEEFDFQFNSHPDYPSLLAISDTLSFFNIANGALKVMSSELELLPNSFIGKLNEGHHSFLAFIEKKGDSYSYSRKETKKTIEVSKEDLMASWDDVVLLIENKDNLISTKRDKKNNYFLFIPLLFLLVALLKNSFSNIWMLSFYIFPIIGFLFSLGALKDLFNTKSELLNKFCKATASSSCETVVNSSKWKLFEIISFSDLCITFFTTQIIALLLMGLTNNYNTYFLIQTILLILSFPVIALSIYYQKFIEKKWCPICLSIIAILVLELVYILFFNIHFFTQISWHGSVLYLFITVSILMIWYSVKKIFKKTNQLKETELKANRFKRDYNIFKKMLVTSEHYNLPKNPLIFGNPNAALKISIITSPFCGHCSEPHYMLKSILDKYGDKLNISILYNVDPKNSRLRNIVKNLIHLNLKNGYEYYYQAMDYWYQTKDDQKWLNKYQTKFDAKNIEHVLEMQHLWFTENDFNFTPCLLVNGYLYPKVYDIVDLQFFIDELLDDRLLVNGNKNGIKNSGSRKAITE